ncbi:MAG TPA: serine/threonine-protein kinase [Blastocatellia bacterium]|nr:serine/threonine-protein kinase [Blastocatellia bacterium]
MNPERWQIVKEVFEAALQHEPSERLQFLEQVCGDDVELLEEIASLLASYEQAGSFIAADAIEDAANLLIDGASKLHRGRFIGHYRMLSMLGKGGMGEVYLAADTRLGREVALKLLPAEFARDAERVKRFEREARIASALNHPNILTIYEIGRDGEALFIATEFIRGLTLRQRLADGAVNPDEAVNIAVQMASALDAAHSAGMVHRDIKPENVMLRPDGIVKVLDFGLAKPAEGPLGQSYNTSMPTRDSYDTAPGALIGTFRYMSPEQARGQSVDHRSDLWSLGAVFYELLAGAPPFGGETPSDIIASILTREPAPIAEPSEPELQNFLARALGKERERRYQSAPEMLRDIQELKRKLKRRSEVRTSTASRRLNISAAVEAPGIEQIAGKTRRKRSLAAVAALLFILAVSSILVAFVQSTRPLPLSFALESAPDERMIAYSIIVQKMRNGETLDEPFEASGRESFESGWKFRFHLVSPQAGYLYLLNEGPAYGGDVNYRIIFPISSINHGSARVEADQQVSTGWYVFSERPGVEKLWVVWAALAAQPLESIKDKVNPVDQGVVSDTTRRDSIREWLAMRAADKITTESGEGARQTVVRGRGDVLARLIELTHRLPQSVGLYDLIRDELSYYGCGSDGHETVKWRNAPVRLNLSL